MSGCPALAPPRRGGHMTSRILSQLIAGLLALAIAGVAAAAGDPQRAEGYITDAKKSVDKGDYRSAVIQLKNAVQADPDNAAARYELGVAELRLGDYLSAEKELRGALDRKFNPDQIAGPLAETLLRLGKNEELLAQISP